jgi:UPF0148 protein
MGEKSEDIKRMADLLRQGATLTDLACPACASPLLKLRNGELWCAKDQKRVIVVSKEEEEKTTSMLAMEKLEATLLSKIQELQNKMQQTDNSEELQKLSSTLSELLGNLEKTRKMKRSQ